MSTSDTNEYIQPSSEFGKNGRKDPTWKYTILQNPPSTTNHICPFCRHPTHGGITRAKHHLTGKSTGKTRINSVSCKKVPPEVKAELLAYDALQDEKRRKNAMQDYIPDFDDVEDMNEEDEVMRPAANPRIRGKMQSSVGSSTQSTRPSKRKGPMDVFLTPDPALEVAKDDRLRKLRQTTIPENVDKELVDRVHSDIARFWYQAGIPFNVSRLKSFRIMLKSVGQFGPNLPPPTYHQLRQPLLKKEKKRTEDLLVAHKEVWATVGCSLMSDGWTDRKGRTLINFLVNSSRGTVFRKSIDASNEIKTGQKIFELFDEEIKEIGPQYVVQVVTDNAANMKLAGRLVEDKYHHIYWTPCAAHCLNLMLKDIALMPKVKKTLGQAMEVIGFLYAHGHALSLMRTFVTAELLRPAVTRFATSFLTLESVHKQKANLRRMFLSDAWHNLHYSKEPKGKAAEKIVHMPSFWNNVLYALKLTAPLVRVLKLVDGEKKPAMGFIYEAMDRAKEAIVAAFGGEQNEHRYKAAFEIIDNRWDVQLHHPLHAAAYYLNPHFFYDNKTIHKDLEVMKGLYAVLEKLVPRDDQDKIEEEMEDYKHARGLFGSSFAIRNRKRKNPADWWMSYGSQTPTLQTLAMKILSLTCSSSGCERNWSTFEHIHSKKRNKLEAQRLNDLVYIKYNQALMERYDSRDVIDPIRLNDIDESNEWLLGCFGEGEENAENDAVFDGDDLRWGDLAAIEGAEEPIRSTRRTRVGDDFGSSSRPSGSRSTPQPQVQEEPDFEEDSDTEEEDIPIDCGSEGEEEVVAEEMDESD